MATVGISLVRAVVQEFERTSKDLDALFLRSGIDRSILDDPYARLDADRYYRLHRAALDLSGDPALGLHMAEHASVGSFSLVGHMAAHCRTIREVLDIYLRYYKIVADVSPPHLIEEGDRAQIVYEFLRAPDLECNRLRGEFGLVRLHLIALALIGSTAAIGEAWFEHPAPAYRDEYTRLFGQAALRFDSPCTGFIIDRKILDTRIIHHDENVLRVLKAQADQWLEQLESRGGVAGKVRRAIVNGYPDIPLETEKLAKQLGMSGRTLRRQLQHEGYTFQKVVGQAMGEIACTLLRLPSMTIQQAAYRLGFSEPSAFHRAFKRWTGMTPTQWRQSGGMGGIGNDS
jgi:AraC-like DNA-binding protein